MKTTTRTSSRTPLRLSAAGLLALSLALSPLPAHGEAMLQFFNAKWTEIAEKVPELAEAGYTSIWLPPPAKANGGYSVGYDLFDPFDLGSTDLRGTWSTRYGTEAELHNLVDTLHRFGIRVYFDNIMNHRAYDVPGYNESTPIDVYPGMVAEDFHLRRTSDGYYRKWDNCRDWNSGWQVMNLGLSDLIDIAHETPNCNHGSYEGATQAKPSVVRHPNNPEFYDRMPNVHVDPSLWNPWDWTGNTNANIYIGFGTNNGLTTNIIAQYPDFFKEDVGAYLCRSVRWMMDTSKADGFRLDAVKHVPDYFFGEQWSQDKDGSNVGYCGNVQWQFNMTHGYSDWTNHRDTVFNIDLPRDDAMLFGEHLGDPPPLDGYIAAGMRLVDNPLRNQLVDAISSYNLWGFDQAGWGGLAPGCGVMHSQSHDNVPKSMDRRPLEQCFYMMREGLGLFYTDGNNHAATLSGSGGAFPRWAESAYLGQWGDTRMPNLCQLNGDFGRGRQRGVYSQGDFVAWERIDDRHGGDSDSAKVTCLVLANAGWNYDQSLPGGDISFPHQGGGNYGEDAFLYQYADVPYVGWEPHFYTYASKLYDGTVRVPQNAYFIFGYKNPDPSSIWPGNVIDVLEDGQIAGTTPLVRTDGVDGDAGYNPYSLPDDDSTDYSYTINVPRVTKGTNVQFRVSVDGSAGDVLLRLDGGMDLNGVHHDNDPFQDLRDNPPALSDDIYLGFEGINFNQRIWPEKFAAANSDNCALGSGEATTFVSESSGATNYASTWSNDYSNHLGQVSWVYHDPTKDTEPFFISVTTNTAGSTNTYTDAASANTAQSTAAIPGFGEWQISAYTNPGSSWSGWFVNNTDPAGSGITGMGYAYGLYANPDTTAGITLERSFTANPADISQFSIKLGMNWDNYYTNSYKGFEIFDADGAIFGIQMCGWPFENGNPTNYYYGVSNGIYCADYGTNAFTVSLARTSGGWTVTGSTRTGGTFSKTLTTARSPTGYKVYMNGCPNASGERQMYFTDVSYSAVSSSSTVVTNLVSAKQLIRSGNSVTVYAKSQKEAGMSAAMYYTTDGSSWPNGAGQVAANAETKVANGTWVTNTVTVHDNGVRTTNDWWKFDVALPSASSTLRYKIGVFHRQGTINSNDYRIIWPGSKEEIAQKLPMLGQWSSNPQDLTTKEYYKHNDYANNQKGFGLPDGLHLLTARAFLRRTDGTPVFKTFRQTFMIDRETPRGELLWPDAGTTDIGGSEYGFILRTDPTVTAVYYHIEDSNGDNDTVGNGMVSNAVVWGQATAASPWTKEMTQNTEFPKLWRFTYNRIPSGGSNATVRIRLVETSSASTNQWSTNNPAADSADALHYTEIEREFHAWGDSEALYFDWPDTDGTYVEEGWELRVKYAKKLADNLHDNEPLDHFKVYIQAEENASTNRGALCKSEDIYPGHSWDGDENTFTFRMPNVYNGVQGWLYGIRVEFTNGTYSKAATRFVTHHGARKPTVAITTPPEVDSDGAAYIIEMPDVSTNVLAQPTNAWMRETPIVVQTDPAVTNVALSFLSAPAGASTNLVFKGMTTNTGSLASWSYVWTVSEPGSYRFTATGWANTNGTTLTVSSNAVLRNATVQFMDIVSNTDTNKLDWDNDGILNDTENAAVDLPSGQSEYWTQAQVFDYFAAGKSSSTSPDTDGDGLPDALELGFRAPQNSDATDTSVDSNGDGIPNFLPDLDPPYYNTTDNYNRVPYAENSSGGSPRTKLCVGSVTDPSNPDTDYDGIPDGIEDANRNGWTDGDGQEFPIGWNFWTERNWPDGKMTGEIWQETSPCIADSDADGLSDGYGEDTNFNGRVDMFLLYAASNRVEILLTNEQWAIYRAGTNTALSRAPNYAKLFEDYAVDGSYTGSVQKTQSGWPHLLILETDPLCTDTDHDGLPDGWEIRYGLDPLDNGVYNFRTGLAGDPRNGPEGDPDDDKIKNLGEFSSGTNPTVSDSAANPGGEGAIVIGEGKQIGEINGTAYYREYLDWTLDDLVALDDYDHGENSSDIYRKFGDGYNSSRDLVAFYFHDGGTSAGGLHGDDKLYFRVDLFDLQAHVEEYGGLNVYVAINFGNYGSGIEDLPNDVECKTAMKWNAVVGVYNSADGVVYVKDKEGDGFHAVEHAYYGAHFNSQLDTIAWSVNRQALVDAGWESGDPDRLLFQVYTTRADPGGSGDKWGLNDLCDTFGDTFLCSDYDQDWDYVASHGTYSTCIGRTAGGPVWNNRGKRARLALLAHGNQAVERACDIQDYVNNGAGAGYHRPVKIHNIYTNCPLNLHITPTLAMALQWAAVDPESDETWRSGPALNEEIAAGVAKGNFRLLGSTYSDHILPFFSQDFNAANIALANETLNTIYGGSPTSSVVSTDILWSSERVADVATLQQIHDLGYRATVIDQVPHLQDWFGRETALGDDGYKLQHIYLERASGNWDTLDAFAISTTAADYRYAAHDSGLSTELRQMFLRRAQSGANVVSTLFYNWEDFANRDNADAYDQCLRWIANHPWIQVVTFEDALGSVDSKDRTLTASLGMSMQDWVNHACNEDYNNWYYGTGRHESLAGKQFELRDGSSDETPLPYGSMTNGILASVWAAVNGISTPSVKRLALGTLSASVFETAFHEEYNSNLSRWSFGEYTDPATGWYWDYDKQDWNWKLMGLEGFSWCAQGQTRMAAIYSNVDAWARTDIAAPQIVTDLDLDLDGEPEPVLRNNAVMAVFERQGGRMVGAWLKQRDADGTTNVVQMIGNFVSMPYSGKEDEGIYNSTTRRTAGLTDWWNNRTNSVNFLYNVAGDASGLSFTNSDSRIGKRISLADATSTTFRVEYQMAGNGNFCVRTGLSPDLDALLTFGSAAVTEQADGTASLTVATTNPAASRVSSVTVDVTTGTINTAATDIYATNNPTIKMRNLAQTRQVEVQTDGNRLDFTITFSSSTAAPDPDTDGNGVPDWWEQEYFGTPTGLDLEDDPDHDGFCNYYEYLAGTNPTNANSYIGWESKAVTGPDSVALTFLCISGATYAVEIADAENLAATRWTQSGDTFQATNTHHTWIDSPTNFTNRFYRLRIPSIR